MDLALLAEKGMAEQGCNTLEIGLLPLVPIERSHHAWLQPIQLLHCATTLLDSWVFSSWIDNKYYSRRLFLRAVM